MIIPADILSYALGLFSSVGLIPYTIGTIVGVSYFSFVFAYLGVAAFESNIVTFAIVGLVSVLVLGLGGM